MNSMGAGNRPPRFAQNGPIFGIPQSFAQSFYGLERIVRKREKTETIGTSGL